MFSTKCIILPRTRLQNNTNGENLGRVVGGWGTFHRSGDIFLVDGIESGLRFSFPTIKFQICDVDGKRNIFEMLSS